jgi:hypothetical protein
MKTWGLPPKAKAEVVYHMEDVLQTDQRPYDCRFPVSCLDEASRQLSAEVAGPRPTNPRQPQRVDDDYERKGVGNQFGRCEPWRGWRPVHVTQRRTQRAWAWCIREWLEGYSPEALKIHLVLDNLHTHPGSS